MMFFRPDSRLAELRRKYREARLHRRERRRAALTLGAVAVVVLLALKSCGAARAASPATNLADLAAAANQAPINQAAPGSTRSGYTADLAPTVETWVASGNRATRTPLFTPGLWSLKTNCDLGDKDAVTMLGTGDGPQRAQSAYTVDGGDAGPVSGYVWTNESDRTSASFTYGGPSLVRERLQFSGRFGKTSLAGITEPAGVGLELDGGVATERDVTYANYATPVELGEGAEYRATGVVFENCDQALHFTGAATAKLTDCLGLGPASILVEGTTEEDPALIYVSRSPLDGEPDALLEPGSTPAKVIYDQATDAEGDFRRGAYLFVDDETENLDPAAAISGELVERLDVLEERVITLTSPGDATDSRATIQAAIDDLAALGGGVVDLRPGVYHVGPVSASNPDPLPAGTWSLRLESNVWLRGVPGQTFLNRRFGGGDDGSNSTVRNDDFEGGNENIGLVGITFTIPDGATNANKNFSVRDVDGVTLIDVSFAGVYHNWNASFTDSENILIRGGGGDSGDELTEDGYHFCGCQGVRISDVDIACGDDCFAFVNDVDHQTQDTSDVVISNCTAYSRKAHVLKAFVADNVTETISKITMRGVRGRTGDGTPDMGGGVLLEDENHPVDLDDCAVFGISVDLALDHTQGDLPVLVRWARDVELDVDIEAAGDNVQLSGKNIGGRISIKNQRGAAWGVTLAIDHASENIALRGGTIDTNGTGVFVGVNHHVSGFAIDGYMFTGDDSGADDGIHVWNGSRGVVTRNRVTGFGGAGIVETEPSGAPTSDFNNFTGNTCWNNGTDTIGVVGAGSDKSGNIEE
jgi:hypothetical protein